MNVLHTFYQYLPNTENWAYRMISNLPEDIQNIIAAEKFLKTNFYNPDFFYISFPLNEIETTNKTLKTKIINRIVRNIREKLFIPYVSWFIKNEKIKVDIVHSHFGIFGWKYRELAKKLNAKHVASFYGHDYEKIPFVQPIWKKRYQELFREADVFLCEGKHGAKILEKMGCPSKKIIINRLGVEIEKIPFFKREKKKGELKLVQIATFRKKKGQMYTVKAFENALKTCPNLTLTLVGNGEERKNIEQYIYKKGLRNKIQIIEKIDFSQLYTFLKDYHVFIHPSCYTEDRDCEGGAPVVILDAQATGMPIISTTHCDIPEEVIHEKTGFLAPEKDIQSLSKYIEIFYNMEQETYNRFSHSAREHIEKFYNIKENAKNLANIYKSLLKENGKTQRKN